MMESNETKLGMKWYNFLVVFGLFAGALMNVGNGITYLTGVMYSRATNGQVTAEQVYSYYGVGLRIVDIIFGVLAIAQAGVAIVLWYKLVKRKPDMMKFIYIYYGVPIIFSFLYLVIVSGITSTSLEFTDIVSIGTSILILCLNIKYFKKREDLLIQGKQCTYKRKNSIEEKNIMKTSTYVSNKNIEEEKKMFWKKFEESLKRNNARYSLMFIEKDIARIKCGTEFTTLFILVEGARVSLYKKENTTEKRLLTDLFHLIKMDVWIAAINGNFKLEAKPIPAGKTLYKLGQVWEGESYVDLVNEIFHQNYKQYLLSTVKLNSFGVDGIAWIVCIDGKPHGRDGDLWINRLIENGNIIEEEYVGVNKYKIRQEFLNPNYRTFADRLTFQKDPSNTGDNYKAKCLGFYVLKSYDIDRLIRVWERKNDSILLTIK